MSNDNKTLADAQPGGMVRLGDQADAASAHDLETIERVAMAMQASENKQSGWTWADCSSIEVEGWMDLARAAVAALSALSAHPSPGGQDAPERCSECGYKTFHEHPDGHICLHCKLIVAARQPETDNSPMAKMAAAAGRCSRKIPECSTPGCSSWKGYGWVLRTTCRCRSGRRTSPSSAG